MATRRWIGVASALIVLALIGGACGGDEDEAGSGNSVTAPEAAMEQPAARDVDEGADMLAAQDSDEFTSDQSGSGSTGTGTAAALPTTSASIIKTATMEIGVPKGDLPDALQEAVSVAGRYGGFVLSTALEKEGSEGGTLTLRVPSIRFERALTDLEDLGEVERRNISGEDVSQQFIDLEARLRNWRAQEAVLLDLMERATTIGETIRVQNELTGIQLEIERIRGRLRYLDDQTSFGTITARFVPAGISPAAKPNAIERAWEQALDGALAVVSGAIVVGGTALPVLLLAALGLLIFRQLRPRVSRGEV